MSYMEAPKLFVPRHEILLHTRLRDSIPCYESFLTSEKRKTEMRERERVTSGDAKDPLDFKHRMDVIMTAESKKQSQEKRQIHRVTLRKEKRERHPRSQV